MAMPSGLPGISRLAIASNGRLRPREARQCYVQVDLGLQGESLCKVRLCRSVVRELAVEGAAA